MSRKRNVIKPTGGRATIEAMQDIPVTQDSDITLPSEYKARAQAFVEEFKDAQKENAESQTFWNEFFWIFGIKRRRVAMFEQQVKDITAAHGKPPKRIDVFWKQVLLIEQKSKGKNLDKADRQAMEYYESLPAMIKPRYVMSSDFVSFHLLDTKTGKKENFTLEELPDKLNLLSFMAGKESFEFEADVSRKATDLITKIYERIWDSEHPAEVEYRENVIAQHKIDLAKAKAEKKRPPEMPSLVPPMTPEQEEARRNDKNCLGRFLMRIAYCYFAEDTGIFERNQFKDYVERKTESDPYILGDILHGLFNRLNTKTPNKNIDYELKKFQYIDGRLFELDNTDKAYPCNQEIRDALLAAAGFDWSKVSPSVFGSMFESVMDSIERQESGSHYTTTENVLKVLEPLFLDDLWNEYYEIIGSNYPKAKCNSKLVELQSKLSAFKFLDPACGSGSFLITAYEQIRKLEYAILDKMYPNKVVEKSVNRSIVDVNQFYGIELNPFAAKITETAMWMVDHLENLRLGKLFGGEYSRLPLEKHANIRIGDALIVDWNDVLPNSECDFIIGNPPFGGGKKSSNNPQQTKRITGSGQLDYVSNWFVKAAEYAKKECRVGLVATNSITQGEQVGDLWPTILDKHHMEIIFGYTTFMWETDAKDGASVAVVILGLSKNPTVKKYLYSGTERILCSYLSPYLRGFDKEVPIVHEVGRPINKLPKLRMGSKLIDKGQYLFTDPQKEQFLKTEPKAERYMKPFVSGKSFLYGDSRWVLDLHGLGSSDIASMPKVKERVDKVIKFRSDSRDNQTSRMSETPTRWHLEVIPHASFMIIPRTSSENRMYIPMGFLDPPAIPSDATMILENATYGLFGLLQSKMHMAWMSLVAGRLGTGYRYSSGVVYNTFPLPRSDIKILEKYAKEVLRIRTLYPERTLADLYNTPMESELLMAHRKLDAAVDRLYRKEPFTSEKERWEFLLDLYEKMVNKQKKLEVVIKKSKPRKSKTYKSKASKMGKTSRKSTKGKKSKKNMDSDSIDSYVNN